jgi:NitT/TauT family transport system substrate-binding protein
MIQSSAKTGKWINLFVLAVLLIALPLQACTPTSPQEPDHVKVAVLPYISNGPLIIAQEEGYFIEQNLDVEFVRLQDGSQMTPMLIQGDLDVTAQGININMLNAIVDGKIKMVADRGYLAADGCTYDGILAPPAWIDKFNASPIEALTEARISTDALGFEGFMVDQLFMEYGVTLASTNITEFPPTTLLEAVQNDALDLMTEGEPWLTRLTDSGLVSVWKTYQEIVPDMQFGVLMYGPNFLEENQEAGIRFMKAYLKGLRQYNEGNTDRNVEILTEYTGLEADLVQRSCWPPMHGDGMIITDTIDAYQEWALSKGYIEGMIPVDDYWDPSFVEQANR